MLQSKTIPKVIVIGAGSAGLIGALKLQEVGYEVPVYEKEPQAANKGADSTMDRFGAGLHYPHFQSSAKYILSAIEFEKKYPNYQLPIKGSDYCLMEDSQFGYWDIVETQLQLVKFYKELIQEDKRNKVFGEPENLIKPVNNGVDERFSNEDGRLLFLLGEIRDDKMEYNNLYLFTAEENQQTILCYKYKTEQGEVHEMKLANNQIEEECLSRIIKTIKENQLNTIKDEDRRKLFKFSTSQSHTHPSCKIEICFKTQEGVLDWRRFREDRIKELKQLHTNIVVEAIEFNYLDGENKYDYKRPLFKLRCRNTKTNEVRFQETDQVVNSSWYKIQHLNETLFKILNVSNPKKGKFCKRLKFRLTIKLREELDTLPTSFFCFGAFFAITNRGDGTAYLIYERINTMQTNDEVLPENMQKFIDDRASEEEKETIIESILKGANRYLKKIQGENAINREHVIELKAGIVMTESGSINMDDPKGSHHMRDKGGVERATIDRKEKRIKRSDLPVIGLVNYAGMKFMYCVSDREPMKILVEDDRKIIEKFRSVQSVLNKGTENEKYKNPCESVESKFSEEKIEQNNPGKEKNDKIKHIFEWQSACFSRIMLYEQLLKNEFKLKEIDKKKLEETRRITRKFYSIQAVIANLCEPVVESKFNEEKIEQNSPERQKDKIKQTSKWESTCFSWIMLHEELLKRTKKNKLKNSKDKLKDSWFSSKSLFFKKTQNDEITIQPYSKDKKSIVSSSDTESISKDTTTHLCSTEKSAETELNTSSSDLSSETKQSSKEMKKNKRSQSHEGIYSQISSFREDNDKNWNSCEEILLDLSPSAENIRKTGMSENFNFDSDTNLNGFNFKSSNN